MKKTHELNRNLFLEWFDGTLLRRDKKGRCIVLDGSAFSRKCEAAEADLDLGGTLYLTDDSGKRITKITLDGEGYTEEAL